VTGVYQAYRYRPEDVIDFDGSLESTQACLEVLNESIQEHDKRQGVKFQALMREDGTMTLIQSSGTSLRDEFAVAPAVIRLQGEFHRPEAIKKEHFDRMFRIIKED
jgi:hypothetical protein